MVPDRLRSLVLMIGTVAPVTPFTVVESVFALDVLLIEFTIGTVAPVTPLTVVDRVLALEVLLAVVDPVREPLSMSCTHALPFQ